MTKGGLDTLTSSLPKAVHCERGEMVFREKKKIQPCPKSHGRAWGETLNFWTPEPQLFIT